MAAVGNVYHDFPRLAKQSGFYFQLHRGRVNWTEIGNLAIEEITEKQNFQLLEQNLLNVINCNLDEYDLKILDQNFVKLFKLAQLGVDYLYYCEMYLDRCVVLLQEQLIALQEECRSLKLENQKTKVENSKGTKKNKTQNYQCEKCEKVFISDVYLKYHHKRRHDAPISPENLEISQEKTVESSQQTEEIIKLSASTQTLIFNEVSTSTQTENENSNKMPLVQKIENLEQELQDLKERLNKTENTLLEKMEVTKPNDRNSLNASSSFHGNPMLMFVPSCLTQTGNCFYEINPGCHVSVPEVRQINNSTSFPAVQSETFPINCSSKPLSERVCQANNELEKPVETEFESARGDVKSISPLESFKTFQDYKSKKDNSECDKENIAPNITNIVKKLTKPLPPPRSKKGIRLRSGKDDKIIVEPLILGKSTDFEENINFDRHLIVKNSTPVKEKSDGEIILDNFEGSRENLSDINTLMANSNDSLASKKSIPIEFESKSFIKSIVPKKSPKLQKLSRNIRKSLTNLYDSVFFTEKELTKKDATNQNLKAAVVDGLNNQLRRLGVDPEWSGIPKKTMKQKLKVLNHRRKLLSKENPAYPILRQNAEEKLFHNLQENLRKKKTVLINKLHKKKFSDSKDPTIQDSSEELFENKLGFVRAKNPVMYEIGSDSSSKTSDAEISFNQDPNQYILQKSVIVEQVNGSKATEEKVDTEIHKEFDLSVFQVGRESPENKNKDIHQKCVSVKKMDCPFTYLDPDGGDSSINLNDKSSIASIEHLENIDTNEKPGQSGNYKEQQLIFLHSGTEKSKGLSSESNTLQSRITMNAKKKVLFENYPKRFKEELSDSPSDDDLWSFKSEWMKEAI